MENYKDESEFVIVNIDDRYALRSRCSYKGSYYYVNLITYNVTKATKIKYIGAYTTDDYEDVIEHLNKYKNSNLFKCSLKQGGTIIH